MSNQPGAPHCNGAKYIIVLPTTHHTLLAEKALQAANVRCLPVPKPQKAVSDCGMALQIEAGDLSAALEILDKQEMRSRVFVKTADDGITPWESHQEDER
ncbi:MAG: hypothetical protein Kow0099_33370 [Candidatus Abyssubacteria bacterium]